jgi:molybdenum cofactor synthesis domain-containing protein
MPCAEILTIGSELTEGLRADTNARWLAEKLTGMGFRVVRITSVGDDSSEIIAAIRDALKRLPDVLILTGGLGPTPDDKTCEALARAVGRRLVLDPSALELVSLAYKRMHARGLVERKGLSPARMKMAHIPRGATPLSNPVGAAPGIKLRCRKTLIFCLPGVPAEMRAIFMKHARDDLAKLSGLTQHTALINVKGVDEATLAPLLGRLLKDFPQVNVRSYPSGKGAKSRIKVMLVAPTSADVKAARNRFKKWIKKLHPTPPC